MSYRISVKATEDLENIWLYTFENWSQDQADRYLNLIFDEIEYVAAHPDAGKDYGHLRKGYRCVQVKAHLIFYKKGKASIEIIRILHQRMDIEHRLTE
jgi:toxin ParE1/3/4